MCARLSSFAAMLLGSALALSLTTCTHGKAHNREAPSARGGPPLLGAGSPGDVGRGDKDDPGSKLLGEPFADTDVLHYNLDIEIFPATKEIAGINTMTVKSLVDGLIEFTFRLHSSLTISSATINGTTPVAVTDLSETTRRATLDRSYDAGEVFTLTIAYAGVPVSEGFGSMRFDKHDGVDVVFTFSCPYYACTWWPCKDGDVGDPGDNSDKATVELAVTAPEQMRTVANGVLRGVDALPGDRKRYRWLTDYPIATYLVCFSSTNYVTWTATYDYGGGTMPVEFNIYPESDNPTTRQRLEAVLVMLDTFGQLYGPYPFLHEKYGIYEFAFGGGMEHQTNTGQGSFTRILTAHELSHQWWGDAVTCRTWHDVWLNEGFATYSEALWKEHRPGSNGAEALHEAMAERRPSRVDGSVYCYDTTSFNRVFNGDFSYRKGAWVLHQLRHVVGDDAFFRILRAYRAAFEGGSATTADFATIAATVAGRDLTWFFDEWVYAIGAPAYRYGWQTEQINGQHYLRLHVRQVQDPTWITFAMPLDVRVEDDAGSDTYVVFNDAEREHFVLPIAGAAMNVVLDEFDWVLHTSLAAEPCVPGPPVVVQADPLPGDVVPPNVAPERVAVSFSEDVAASAADFALTEAATGPVAFTFSYSPANYTATLQFSEALPMGTYTVTVADSIQSVNAIALDGEIDDPLSSQSLPSGEGLPGGNAVFSFLVRCPGDLDSDNQVDTDDLKVLLYHYRTASGAVYEDGDLDHDGDVDLEDLATLLAMYGTTCE